MPGHISESADGVARRIVELPECELTEFIHELRQTHRLCDIVRALNRLVLTTPPSPMGREALRRLVLELGG